MLRRRLGHYLQLETAGAGFPARWLKTGVEGIKFRIRDRSLEIRSPRAMKGYVFHAGKPPMTSDGWLITNDMVVIRGDRVVFLGREDSLINVGGSKVSPEEVESVLLEVPGVVEAKVIGVSNPITGFLVGAEIVLSAGCDEGSLRRAILAHAKASLQAFKVPRLIKFVPHNGNNV